jgi:hypothetical protein
MDLKSSVTEFFHEAVTSAIRNQGVDTSTPTECYLVNLLANYAKAPVADEPLGLKMAQAVFATPDERVRHLREVGDTSLYVSGFFAESLNRKLVDVDYYIQLGESAYGELARHFRVGRGAVFSDVYDELGAKFPRFVDVLAEISESTSVTTNASVVQLYERWLRTGSEWMARRLRARGVLPGNSETH